ncbi:hypothetical protein [Halobacterium wangiae]|uniref:hypothetical protein n=1 Tax=Halobacterium wangiae TaxID=2902623 RepID=UPI001E30C5C5|nr:hypothetical protein [Halobacterium wangiae]
MQADQPPVSRIARQLDDSVAPTRYDLVLAVIPLAFLASVFAGATALPWSLALACGGGAAVAATAYALFLAPPTTDHHHHDGLQN